MAGRKSSKSSSQKNRIRQIRQTWQALLWLMLCICVIGLVISVAKQMTEPEPIPIVSESGVQENGVQESGVQSGDAQAEEAEIIYLTPEEVAKAGKGVNLADIPAYNGEAFVVINDNVPYFAEGEMSLTAYEYYSPLDELKRCGVCVASVGIDVMPTEERGGIGSVKPTGWVNNKYPGVVDGSYIYNRCHLIGFQLTGENANKQNLITGTRYINVDGMLPFENMVADYVKETGNHVMYRITPVFDGDNLLASGVLMEAKSVEDDGEGILFNVYCYNVQPGIGIDYATGENWLEK